MATKTYDQLCAESLAGAALLQNAHYAAAAYYQWCSKLVGLPAAMLGSVTTTSMASLCVDGDLAQWAKIAATVCGLLSLISGSLMATLNLPGLANQHQIAAIAWGSLRGKLARLAVTDLAANVEIVKVMEQLGHEWDQINRAAPVLYTRFLRSARAAAAVPAPA